MEAAERLYGGSGSNVEMYAQMGMSPEEIQRRVAEEARPLGIWPENWAAVQVFERCATQWRHGPCRITGLDYAALPVLFGLLEVTEKQLDVFDQVRLMEAHVLDRMINKA